MKKAGWILNIIILAINSIVFASEIEKVAIEKIVSDPVAFNGQFVQIHGNLYSGFENFYIADSVGSDDGIWIDYPSKDAHGFQLKRDQQFQKMMNGLPDWRGMKNCNMVQATLKGKIEAVDKAGFIRDLNGKIIGVQGFGHLRAYRVRILVQSVSDVVVHKRACKEWNSDDESGQSLKGSPKENGSEKHQDTH